MNFKYLVIEGPIGAGKTTLAKKLASKFHSEKILDQPWDNPFLEKFYKGVEGAAFKAQLYFLAQRYSLLKVLTREFPSRMVVSDFLLEKDKIFAYVNLSDEELEVYNALFNAISDYLVKPDFVIYLKAEPEVLIQRIHKRGIDFEKAISVEYLKNLIDSYDHFFFQYNQRASVPVLVLESSKVNFTADNKDLDLLVDFLRTSSVVGLQYYNPAGKG